MMWAWASEFVGGRTIAAAVAGRSADSNGATNAQPCNTQSELQARLKKELMNVPHRKNVERCPGDDSCRLLLLKPGVKDPDTLEGEAGKTRRAHWRRRSLTLRRYLCLSISFYLE